MFFNITVSLPTGKDVTTIPNFETSLPKFGQFIATLEKHAFGNIFLHSSDSPIFVEVCFISTAFLVVVTLKVPLLGSCR